MTKNRTVTWLIWPFYSENNPVINQYLENIIYDFFTDSYWELSVDCIFLFVILLCEWRKQKYCIIRNFHFANFKNIINKKREHSKIV